MLSDRDVLTGMYCLLSSLAEKLTGETPRVTFQSEDGQTIIAEGNSRVEWVSQQNRNRLLEPPLRFHSQEGQPESSQVQPFGDDT